MPKYKRPGCPSCGRVTPTTKPGEVCWWCKKGIVLKPQAKVKGKR